MSTWLSIYYKPLHHSPRHSSDIPIQHYKLHQVMGMRLLNSDHIKDQSMNVYIYWGQGTLFLEIGYELTNISLSHHSSRHSSDIPIQHYRSHQVTGMMLLYPDHQSSIYKHRNILRWRNFALTDYIGSHWKCLTEVTGIEDIH